MFRIFVYGIPAIRLVSPVPNPKPTPRILKCVRSHPRVYIYVPRMLYVISISFTPICEPYELLSKKSSNGPSAVILYVDTP